MAIKAPYYIAFIFFVLSFLLVCVSFGTGYWFESEGEGRLFRRLGLWEVCFDGYEHTEDYIGKAYYGCWWILHKEYSYIRSWIMPSWFIGVQVLMTFAVITGICGMVVFPMAGADTEDSNLIQWITTGIAGFLFTNLCISVVTFGVMVGEDRTWMPKPDEDKMGWSFGLAVLAGFFAAFSTISMFVYCVLRWYEIKYKDVNDQYSMSYPMKSGFSGSAYGGASSAGGSKAKYQASRQAMPMRDIAMVPKV